MQAAANAIPLPTELGGVTVEVDGMPVPLFFTSMPQINYQMPNAPIQPPLTEEGGSKNKANTVTVVVKHSGVESNPVEVEIAAHSPAIFTADFGVGRAIAFNGVDGALAHPVGSFPGSASRSNAADSWRSSSTVSVRRIRHSSSAKTARTIKDSLSGAIR